MARKRGVPHIYIRSDRPNAGYYAYLAPGMKNYALGTNDPIEAQKALVKLLAEPAIHIPTDSRKTIKQVFDETFKRAAMAPFHTRKNLLRRSNRWLTYFTDNNILHCHQITKQDIENYKHTRMAYLASKNHRNPQANWNMDIDTLVRNLKVAAELKLCNPTFYEMIRKPIVKGGCKEKAPKNHGMKQGLTQEEQNRFIENIEEKYYPLCRLVLGTGMRHSELFHNLDLEDIGEKSIQIMNKPGHLLKDKEARQIPCSPETIEAARMFVNQRNAMNAEDLIHFGDNKMIWRALRRACKKAKVRRFSLHYIRKLFCTNMFIASKGNMPFVMRVMGHSDVATTQRYLLVDNTSIPLDSLLF